MDLTQCRILVTGVCGTVGLELARQLIDTYRVKELIGLDNNESDLFFIEERFGNNGRARFALADVRDRDKLALMMKGVDIVFHAAAFKHVTLCERSPFEAVQTNIIGVQNIIQAAISQNVSRVIFTSSDKAVNPTNVMGTSKLMGERLMTAANSNLKESGQVFASTRFGNVLGSRGSVIPLFQEQIRRGGPVTLTNPDMTRFIMSKAEAVKLVIDSASLACGGEVFVTKMPVIRIQDLAEVMIESLAPVYGWDPADIPMEIIGVKPGEKMYEELLNGEETRRTVELQKYFAILPAFANLYRNIRFDYDDTVSEKVSNAYHSANGPFMSKAEIAEFLSGNHLLTQDTQLERHPPCAS